MDIYTTPAAEAPEGETSNLINPVSLLTTRIGVCSVSLGFAVLFTAIRVYVRCTIKAFNSDDCWSLLVSLMDSIDVANFAKGSSSLRQCASRTEDCDT